MLTDDVYNLENAWIVIIMKEMANEIVGSDHTETKEWINQMFTKFKSRAETWLSDSLIDQNHENFVKIVDIFNILKLSNVAI